MQPPKLPANEFLRLDATKHLNILDTPREKRFDKITKEAAKKLHVPICTISIIDAHREWFKSCVGTATTEGLRELSFCGHTILTDKMLIVEDTLKDSRFIDNPQVLGSSHIRFYAGIVLHDQATHLPVGAFCIKDVVPRYLTSEDLEVLTDLAHRVEIELNNRKS